MGKKFDTPEERRLYNRRHYRVSHSRGPAILNKCVGCEGIAREWSQRHGTSGDNPEEYDPMCHRCHQKYDGKWNQEERAKVGATGRANYEALPEEEKARRSLITSIVKTGVSRPDMIGNTYRADAVRRSKGVI